MTFGVQGWACVSLLMPGRSRGILGFDTFRPAWGVFFPRPVVRLAGDAIGAAIERDLSERARVRLAARLERALRMQMVGQLASGVAHNFNNIIAAIQGYSEMAAAEIEANAKAALSCGDPTGSGTGPRPHRQHPDLRAAVGRAHESRVGVGAT
jgi:signal transduction histidine kinase